MLCYDCAWNFWEADFPTVFHVYALFDNQYRLESITICSSVPLMPLAVAPLASKLIAIYGFEHYGSLYDPFIWKYKGSTMTCKVGDFVMPKSELDDNYEIQGHESPKLTGNLVDTFYEIQKLRSRGITKPLQVCDLKGNLICEVFYWRELNELTSPQTSTTSGKSTS